MSSGVIISFEGMEGAGKTTQCDLLAEKLREANKEVVVVREPGGVEIAEQIRDVVLDEKNTAMADTTEVLLFEAARAQLYGEVVLPALAEGKFVLMDRTRDSSTVYQGMVRGIGRELIEEFNDFATQNIYPELTFLLDLPAEEGLRRRREAGKLDRIEQEGVKLQEKVCAAYLKLADENERERWLVLDGARSIEELAVEIWQTVKERFIAQ